jgi:trehalose utilization protein
MNGVLPYFGIEARTMYDAFFDILQPDEHVFISSFAEGEVLRSAAASTVARAGSSSSARVTRSTRSITTRWCAR